MPSEHALKGVGIIRRKKRDDPSANVDKEPDRLSGTLWIEVRPVREVPGAPDPTLPSADMVKRSNERTDV
jgi:hypothetical protein